MITCILRWKVGENSHISLTDFQSYLVHIKSFNYYGIVNQEESYKGYSIVTREENSSETKRLLRHWKVSDFIIGKAKENDDLKKMVFAWNYSLKEFSQLASVWIFFPAKLNKNTMWTRILPVFTCPLFCLRVCVEAVGCGHLHT